MVQYYRYDLNRCSRTGFLLATPVTIEVLCSELDPISSSGRNGIPFLSVLSTLKHLNESMVSTHPKNISRIGSIPPSRGETEKIFDLPPPSFSWCLFNFSWTWGVFCPQNGKNYEAQQPVMARKLSSKPCSSCTTQPHPARKSRKHVQCTPWKKRNWNFWTNHTLRIQFQRCTFTNINAWTVKSKYW